MKITKRGETASERMWFGRCHACGSEAEAVEKEMKNIVCDKRVGGSFSWEACPVCKAGSSGHGYGGMLFHPVKK